MGKTEMRTAIRQGAAAQTSEGKTQLATEETNTNDVRTQGHDKGTDVKVMNAMGTKTTAQAANTTPGASRRQRFGAGAKLASIALAAVLGLGALSGCSAADANADAGSAASAQTTVSDTAATAKTGSTSFAQVSYVTNGSVQVIADIESLFSARDLDPSYSEADVVEIALADGATSVDGSGVKVDGNTITITNEGIYRVSGSLSEGQIVVNAPDTAKVQIILDDASISNSSSAAIYAVEADKVFLTLEGSSTLSTTGSFADANDASIDGVIFSRCDLTIAGDGALNISSSYHGIVAKDELTLVSGTIAIDAAATGMQANDSIAVASGSYTISAGTDGIHCENTDDSSKGYIFVGGGSFDITAASDGIDSKNAIQINDGTLAIAAGDDGIHADLELAVNGGSVDIAQSYEGLEGAQVYMAGGTVNIVASDDAINATGNNGTTTSTDTADDSRANFGGGMMGGMGGGPMGDTDETAVLEISGGKLTVDSSGDGLDTNGYMYIKGGEVYVSGPASDGESPLDYGLACEVSGGTIVVVGSAGMLEPFTSGSTQANISMALSTYGSGTVQVLDASGNVVLEYTPTKNYAAVMVSSPELQVGETYTIVSGGEQTSVTLESICTTSGSMGMGMGGMMGGGMQGGMGGQMPSDQMPSGAPSGQMPGQSGSSSRG